MSRDDSGLRRQRSFQRLRVWVRKGSWGTSCSQSPKPAGLRGHTLCSPVATRARTVEHSFSEAQQGAPNFSPLTRRPGLKQPPVLLAGWHFPLTKGPKPCSRRSACPSVCTRLHTTACSLLFKPPKPHPRGRASTCPQQGWSLPLPPLHSRPLSESRARLHSCPHARPPGPGTASLPDTGLQTHPTPAAGRAAPTG